MSAEAIVMLDGCFFFLQKPQQADSDKKVICIS